MAGFISATLVSCRDEERKLLLVQEGKDHVHGKWDLPGGGLEHDETVKECAEREVREETGYEIEANGFHGVYIEESDTTDVPVIVFLVSAEIVDEHEENHAFEGEILDHRFFTRDEIEDLDLRKENRSVMLEELGKESLPMDRLRDLRTS